MAYVLVSDHQGSVKLRYNDLAETKRALVELFTDDAAMEDRELDPDLHAQIQALTDNESGAELHGHNLTETFYVVK